MLEMDFMGRRIVEAANDGDNPPLPAIAWAALCPRGEEAGPRKNTTLWSAPTIFLLDHPQGYFVTVIVLRMQIQYQDNILTGQAPSHAPVSAVACTGPATPLSAAVKRGDTEVRRCGKRAGCADPRFVQGYPLRGDASRLCISFSVIFL